MDLVQVQKREDLYQERSGQIREKSEVFKQSMQTYATSIWDQSLYKAWGSIVHSLVPNLELIESYMRNLADVIEAEELILFERTTFLTVSSYTSKAGSKNPFPDRHERISNIMKAFKNSLAYVSSSFPSGRQGCGRLTTLFGVENIRLLQHLRHPRINSPISPKKPSVLRNAALPSTVSQPTPTSSSSSHLARPQRTARA